MASMEEIRMGFLWVASQLPAMATRMNQISESPLIVSEQARNILLGYLPASRVCKSWSERNIINVVSRVTMVWHVILLDRWRTVDSQ